MKILNMKDNAKGIIYNSRSTDFFLIGCSETGKSSLLSGLFSEGLKAHSITFNAEQLKNPLESYRTYYNLLESVVSETMIPRCDNDFNAIPVLVDMHSEGLRNKFATFYEINGGFWEKVGSGISDTSGELKRLMGEYYVSQNRKILVFAIDYEKAIGENSTSQRSILDNVLLSLCNDGEVDKDGRFTKNSTMSSVEAVFVVITKSDLMGTNDRATRKSVAEEFLNNEYLSFMDSLSEMCVRFKINKGNDFKPIVETFSIGPVTGRSFNYDPQDSKRLLAVMESCCITCSNQDVDNYNKKLQKEEEIRKYNDERVNELSTENEELKGRLSKFKNDVDEIVDGKCANVIRENDKLKNDYDKLTKKRLKIDVWALLSTIVVVAVFLILIFSRIEYKNGKLKDDLKTANQKIFSLNEKIVEKDADVVGLKEKVEKSNYRIEKLEDDISTIRSQKNRAEIQVEDLKKVNDRIKSKAPIIVTDLNVGNAYHNRDLETEYGGMIYSNRTMFLQPRITYIPVNVGKYIDVYIKLYKPNNELSVGNESPSGYSTKSSMYVSESGSSTLIGWGNENKGNWSSGTYRYEIWYDERILYSKTFRIY